MKAKELLSKLTLEDYEKIFIDMGVKEIKKSSEYWQLPTLCHNLDFSKASYKLYFYLDTCTTFCFTECQKSRDIIDLIKDRWELEGRQFKFIDILNYICRVCGINNDTKSSGQLTNPLAWKNRLSAYQPNKNSHYLGKRYSKDVLSFLSPYHHPAFLEDGISEYAMSKFNIGYYPPRNQITIPVYDLDGELIGIHCRNLDEEEVKSGRKYIPLKTISGMDYRFKSHEVLYGLNVNESYIKYKKEIQLFESPKAVLQLASMYPQSTAVGMFGLNLNKQRRDIILELGVSEVIIGIDKDYMVKDFMTGKTTSYGAYCNNVIKIAKLFQGFCKVSVLYDARDLLGYKDSPTDRGRHAYELLYKERVKI